MQTVKCGHHEVALPLKKTRVLPKWMIGAAKRISLNSQQELAANSSTTKRRIGLYIAGTTGCNLGSKSVSIGILLVLQGVISVLNL